MEDAKKLKVFMLVGIPGSGKSTWAKENLGHYNMFDEIYSADAYRLKLFNRLVTNQEENKIVFNHMHTDIIYALKEGKSICYDATNLTRKDRHYLLNLLELNKIDCEKICVLFEVEESIAREQNRNRAAVVPEAVIDRMLLRFELPLEGEGFDTINIVRRTNLPLVSIDEILNNMNGFNQYSKWHNYDLLTHCNKCLEEVKKYKDVPIELEIAAQLHDIGKLSTQSFDSDGAAHYYGHENYGAYQALFLDYYNTYKIPVDTYKIVEFINYHMEPFRIAEAKDNTKQKHIQMFNNDWQYIEILHKADEIAEGRN